MAPKRKKKETTAVVVDVETVKEQQLFTEVNPPLNYSDISTIGWKLPFVPSRFDDLTKGVKEVDVKLLESKKLFCCSHECVLSDYMASKQHVAGNLSVNALCEFAMAMKWDIRSLAVLSVIPAPGQRYIPYFTVFMYGTPTSPGDAKRAQRNCLPVGLSIVDTQAGNTYIHTKVLDHYKPFLAVLLNNNIELWKHRFELAVKYDNEYRLAFKHIFEGFPGLKIDPDKQCSIASVIMPPVYITGYEGSLKTYNAQRSKHPSNDMKLPMAWIHPSELRLKKLLDKAEIEQIDPSEYTDITSLLLKHTGNVYKDSVFVPEKETQKEEPQTKKQKKETTTTPSKLIKKSVSLAGTKKKEEGRPSADNKEDDDCDTKQTTNTTTSPAAADGTKTDDNNKDTSKNGVGQSQPLLSTPPSKPTRTGRGPATPLRNAKGTTPKKSDREEEEDKREGGKEKGVSDDSRSSGRIDSDRIQSNGKLVDETLASTQPTSPTPSTTFSSSVNVDDL